MRSNTWYRYILAVLLLAVYVLTFVQEGHIHFHHHADHQHALHDDHCEEDVCHASIYHQGAADCGHKAHYIPAEDPCYDCHEIAQLQHFEEPVVGELAPEEYTPQEFIGMDLCDHFEVHDTNVRGPPSLHRLS